MFNNVIKSIKSWIWIDKQEIIISLHALNINKKQSQMRLLLHYEGSVYNEFGLKSTLLPITSFCQIWCKYIQFNSEIMLIT